MNGAGIPQEMGVQGRPQGAERGKPTLLVPGPASGQVRPSPRSLRPRWEGSRGRRRRRAGGRGAAAGSPRPLRCAALRRAPTAPAAIPAAGGRRRKGRLLRSPAPFPGLLLTLTSGEGAAGTLRPRPRGSSRGPGLRGTCPPGPGRGRAGRAAGCSRGRPAVGAAIQGCLACPPRRRRVTGRSPSAAPFPPCGNCVGFPSPASLRPEQVWRMRAP